MLWFKFISGLHFSNQFEFLLLVVLDYDNQYETLKNKNQTELENFQPKFYSVSVISVTSLTPFVHVMYEVMEIQHTCNYMYATVLCKSNASEMCEFCSLSLRIFIEKSHENSREKSMRFER